MTILIVDDHPMVLRGIHSLLSASFAEATLVEASGAEEAKEAFSKQSIDVLITDLDLKGESGLALIKHVRQVMPTTQVIIYTMHEEPWSVSEMADADTEAVVMKGDNAAELITAVKRLSEGKGYYSPTFYRLMGEQRLQPGRLSKREIEVIEWTAKGLSATDMAEQLGISAHTIEFHRRRIMQKLDVTNAAEMIKRATELGWNVNI